MLSLLDFTTALFQYIEESLICVYLKSTAYIRNSMCQGLDILRHG